ncbi:O-antigen translocase [Pseudoalteromonas sp. MMG013]|uniref:O-antigen translocase n=1 Tax=Pseudoalteromonas sp. MMG013 TaxID=2822687 RepID=UPI001B3631A8|nr:O-antigen translocase [Pseudoalteromonas sp. MMG013]MBQ4860870.1 O-antigen translocase [Pseudoalteromonas sp. MMG013]
MKTSFWSAVATAFKFLSGLVINKALALFVGPAGLAVVGQFQNFIQIAMTMAQGAINTGVTKYTAEYKDDPEKLKSLLSSSFMMSMASSVVVSVIVAIFAEPISVKVTGSTEYQYVFYLFSVGLFLFVFNNLYISIVNGFKDIGQFVKVNVTQSVVSLFVTSILVYLYGLLGALIAMAINQSVVFFLIIPFFKKQNHVSAVDFKGKLDKGQVKKLLSYSAVGIATAVCGPLAHMLVREELMSSAGMDVAGQWQAVWYISTMYLMMISTILSVYYLPRLSEIKQLDELKSEVAKSFAVIIPIVSILSFVIYLLRDLVIVILFSEEFTQASDLMLFQLMGDVMRVGCILFTYLLLARAKTKSFFVLEVMSAVSFVLLSYWLILERGASGVTLAFFVNSTLMFTIFFILYSISFKKRLD